MLKFTHSNQPNFKTVARLSALLSMTAWLAACATSTIPAPIQERNARTPTSSTTSGAASGGSTAQTTPITPAVAPSQQNIVPHGPFADKAGQPGYYTTKPGDTVMRVALETGQYWRDIVRWNSMENPNVLDVGQVLRVAPPAGEPQTKPVAPVAKVDGKPLSPASAAVSVTPAPASAPVVVTPPPAAPPAQPSAATAGDSSGSEEDVAWAWPAAGSVIAPFDETRNKGIDIAGKMGDPVYCAADGRVLYADAGLRGYGNLVIVRHNNTFLSAYAHNSKLLVKEGDIVRRNQRIAEMGNSATDRVKLHFEIRRQGKAIDPAKLLPSK